MVTAQDPVAVKSLLTSAIRMTGATTMIDRLRNAVRRLGETEYDGGTDTFRDPLAHPALKAMSSRELADLPFPRHSRASRCR
jgi:hypothetical protein